MAKLVSITGRFLDPSDTPLIGEITITPYRKYLIDSSVDTLYAGPTRFTLSTTGELKAQLLASIGWEYKVDFNLHTQQGFPVNIESSTFTAPQDTVLPDVLDLSILPPSNEPISISTSDNPGEARVYGVSLDPEDPGAVLIPINRS